ncbi:MAG: hypothetical protein AAF750_04235 [Planctomycetota bacterium]
MFVLVGLAVPSAWSALAGQVDSTVIPMERGYIRLGLSEKGTLFMVNGQRDGGRLQAWADVGGRVEAMPLPRQAGAAVDVVYKPLVGGGRFVAAFKDSRELQVFDALGKPLPPIVLPETVGRVGALAAPSSSDVPWVMAAVVGDRRAGLLLVDVDKRQVEASYWANGSLGIDLLSHSRDNAIDLHASADGRYLYSRRFGVSPTGMRVVGVWRSSDGSLSVEQLVSEHMSVTAYVPGPFGQSFIANNTRYHADGQKHPGPHFSQRIIAAAPSAGVVFALGRRQDLSVLDEQSGAVQATYQMIAKAPPGVLLPKLRAVSHISAAVVNEAAGLLVFSTHDQLRIIRLADLGLRRRALTGLSLANGPNALVVGEPWSFKLQVPAGHRVTLDDPPTGLALNGNRLDWIPGMDQTNQHVIRLRVQSPTAEPEQYRLLVRVALRSVRHGLDVLRHAASADGRWLALLGTPRRYTRNAGDTLQLAVVDLQSLNVVAQTTLNERQAAIAIAIVGNRLFVASGQHVSLDAYNLQTLKPEAQVFLPEVATDLFALGDRLVAAHRQAVPTVLRASDLKPVDEPAPDATQGRARQQRSLFTPGPERPVVHGDKTAWHGFVYQQGRPVLALGRAMTHLNDLAGRRSTPNFRGPAPHTPASPWGVTLSGDSLITGGTQRIGTTSSSLGVVLHDHPLAVTVTNSVHQHHHRRGRAEPTRLELYDLVSARVVRQIPLRPASLSPQRSYPPVLRDGLLRVGPYLVVIDQEAVFRLRVQDVVAPAQPPLHITCEQPLVIASAANNTLRYAVNGGEQPVSLRLLHPAPGLSLDASTGVVTMDHDALLRQGQERLGRQLGIDRVKLAALRLTGPPSRDQLRQAWTGRLQQQLAPMRQGLPRELAPIKGLPASVTVTLEARDARQRVATFEHTVFLDLPTDRVVGALVEQGVARGLEEARQAAAAPAGPTPPTPSGDSALRRRVMELERENLRLRAQVDLLRSMLEGRAPATQPGS